MYILEFCLQCLSKDGFSVRLEIAKDVSLCRRLFFCFVAFASFCSVLAETDIIRSEGSPWGCIVGTRKASDQKMSEAKTMNLILFRTEN